MNDEVDTHISRSDQWPGVIATLRPTLLDSGLTEDIKWANSRSARRSCFTSVDDVTRLAETVTAYRDLEGEGLRDR